MEPAPSPPFVTPFVTIAVASSDHEACIEACLESARRQDYPRDRIEIVVADAMSMDATREIVLAAARADPRVRLLDNTKRTRAAALRCILEEAKGEILVPMDPSSDYGRTHVSKCVSALGDASVDSVMVVPRTSGRTLRERALSAVQKTRLAYATARELAVGDEPGVVGAVRTRAAAFDAEARFGEDAALVRELEGRGASIAVRRDIVVHRSEAASFKELFQKHWRFGESRAHAVAQGQTRDPRELAPAALLTIGGALLLTSAVQPFTGIAALLYALKTGAAAVRIAKREGLPTMPVAWAAYPVMHAAHGGGFAVAAARAAKDRLSRLRRPR